MKKKPPYETVGFTNCKNPDCVKAMPDWAVNSEGLCADCAALPFNTRFDEMSILAANTLGQLKMLEKSYQQLLSGVRQAIGTYYVNPTQHTELATVMCEYLEGKRK